MNRSPLSLTLAAALLASVALAGCKGNKNQAADTQPSVSTPAATPAPLPSGNATPSATGINITTVELGNAIGADNRVTTAATTFKPSDTIHVSVATSGGAANMPLTARWIYQDGQVVNTETRTVAGTGPSVQEFHISKPSGWPAGQYRVEIVSGDNVLQTREFSVQ